MGKKVANFAGNVSGVNSARALAKGDVKRAVTSAVDPTGFGEKGLNKLGIGLEDEQGAYNDEAILQDFLRTADPNVDPITGMDRATKYIQDNALTKGTFGEGGLQTQLATQGTDLSKHGFRLSQDDHEAYGQVAGDVSRLFGQQEQATSQNLARRGLASAGSGASGAAFSGLTGNKFEMLAKAQNKIANDRMTNTANRLAQNHAMQMQLTGMGAGLAQNQFENQVSGRQRRIAELSGVEDSESRTLAAQQAAVKPGLFSTIGQGLQAGVGNLATQAPGMLVTGGIPTGATGTSGKSALATKSNTFSTTPNTSLHGNTGRMYT